MGLPSCGIRGFLADVLHDSAVHLMSSMRPKQAERRARTLTALVEAAAVGLSRYGYANLMLERVAIEAGYSRGAIYHLFANKEELALAVVKSVEEMYEQPGNRFADETDPVEILLAVARGHFNHHECRGVLVLRAELGGQDHLVGQAAESLVNRIVADTARLITSARSSGAIPPGPPPQTTALAFVSVLEAVYVNLSDDAPFDAELAERAARGLLGLAPPTVR